MIDLPKATYMYWQKRFNEEQPEDPLITLILAIRKENKDYGYRRLWGELRRQGHIVNKKRVQRLVQKLGLQITSFTRKSRKYNSYRGQEGNVAPNILRQRFNTPIPYQKVTTDTTEFKYIEVNEQGITSIKKLYLDPFLDMCSGEIVSYSISKQPSADGIMGALERAIQATNTCPYQRIFHSDQGWAYQMKSYQRALKKNKIRQSMSRKGNCLDNAVMESFFGLMKQEMYYGLSYQSYEALVEAITEYIAYYNERRIKQKLGWKSPVEYRLNLLAA